jgi:hypothetical protein
MQDTVEIGGAPFEENCAQTGSKQYDAYELNRLECRAYIVALKRKYGEPPDKALLRIRDYQHDFGTYCETVCRYDTDDEAAMAYATKVEKGLATWASVGMWPPVTYDETGRHAVHIIRKPDLWLKETNPDCQTEPGGLSIGAVLASKPLMGAVPLSWVTMTMQLSARPLLALLAEVDRRGIAHDDLDSVRAVWDELRAKPPPSD